MRRHIRLMTFAAATAAMLTMPHVSAQNRDERGCRRAGRQELVRDVREHDEPGGRVRLDQAAEGRADAPELRVDDALGEVDDENARRLRGDDLGAVCTCIACSHDGRPEQADEPHRNRDPDEAGSAGRCSQGRELAEGDGRRVPAEAHR